MNCSRVRIAPDWDEIRVMEIPTCIVECMITVLKTMCLMFATVLFRNDISTNQRL